MFTVTFGKRGYSTQTASLFTATVIANALAGNGWPSILVTDPDGNRVNWKV